MPVDLIGHSPNLVAIKHAASLLAPLQSPIWITGDAGVGKKLTARYLHQFGSGKNKSLIVFDCSTYTSDQQLPALQASVAAATAATLLIADALYLSLDSQQYLLYLLNNYGCLNVRLIITSQAPVTHLIPPWAALSIIAENRLDILPLSARSDDIAILAEYFLNQCAQELETSSKQLSSKALEVLSYYSWPGNIRQLKSCCRWLTLMVVKNDIGMHDLPPDILSFSQEKAEQWVQSLALWVQHKLEAGEANALNNALPLFEHTLIRAALKHSGGRRQEAAKLLGIGRNTLTRKLHEFSINSKQDKE